MANFTRAETSARLLKQVLSKSNCRLHGEGFSPGRNSARAENPSPVCAILVLNGFVNTIDRDQNQSDLSDLTLSMRRVTGSP